MNHKVSFTIHPYAQDLGAPGSTVAFRIYALSPITQNEPNFSPANSQSPKAKSCFSRNEPNLTPATPRLRKTNPIYTRPTIKNAKRTQFTVPPPHLYHETNPITAYQVSRHPMFMRNEPNFQQPIYILQSTIYNPMAQSPYGQGPGTPGCPHYAKQTQFTTPYTIRNIQYTIPSPNLTPAAPRLCENEPNLPPEPPIYELPTTNYELFMQNKRNYQMSKERLTIYA